MELEPIMVEAENGEKVQARLAKCECGSVEFTVFQIEGHDHFHIQCTDCQVSFCPQGKGCSAHS